MNYSSHFKAKRWISTSLYYTELIKDLAVLVWLKTKGMIPPSPAPPHEHRYKSSPSNRELPTQVSKAGHLNEIIVASKSDPKLKCLQQTTTGLSPKDLFNKPLISTWEFITQLWSPWLVFVLGLLANLNDQVCNGCFMQFLMTILNASLKPSLKLRTERRNIATEEVTFLLTITKYLIGSQKFIALQTMGGGGGQTTYSLYDRASEKKFWIFWI